tara:strand:- start:284 stop:1342 length:1059 start_codon:yes stop_codon:yes gene_type:complete
MNKLISNDKYYDFQDVLIVPIDSQLNSRKDVNLERKICFKNGYTWSGIPIVAANMTTTGTFEIYKILSKYKIITALNKFYTLQDFKDYNNEMFYQNINDKLNPDFFMISTGISDENYLNLKSILEVIDCKFICIDIANGYIENFKEFCKKIRNEYPSKIIVAGNVVTKEAVEYLSKIGIDIIKIGIGPGSACTTRIQTGIGMPQLSCNLECCQIAHNNGSYIISDGGITCPGDCAKAFVAGADFVMIGGEFSGHDENPGSIIEENGNKFKLFYGMSSSYAMQKNYATQNNYRSSEGRVLKIKYKGSLEKTVENYLGGLRSTCTYTNSKNIYDLYTNGKFILVNNQYNNHLLK